MNIHLPPCLSWLAALALCGGVTNVGVAAESAAAPASAPTPVAPVTVPFDFSKSAVEVDVNVRGTPLHMLLDTGVNPSVIDLATADRLGLPVDRGDGGEASGFGDGPGAAVFPATVAGLAIGGQSFAGFDALAADMGGISAGLGRRVDGVLGYSFLSDKTVLVDYVAHRVAILPRAEDAAPLIQACKTRWTTPLKTVDSFPVIPDFRLGEARAPVSLDTGSTGQIGLFQSALGLPGVRSALQAAGTVVRTGARGEARSTRYRFEAPVGFGPFTLPAGASMSTYADTGSTDTRVANVGNSLLAALHLKLLLDYRGQTLGFYGDCPAD